MQTVVEPSFFGRIAVGVIVLEFAVAFAVIFYKLRWTSRFLRSHATAAGPEDSSPLSGRQQLVARARRALTDSNVSILDTQPRSRVA